MSSTQVPAVFPSLHSCARLSPQEDTVYDAKFYPYATKDDDQIVAVVTGSHAIVYRLRTDLEIPFEVLRWFRDGLSSGAAFNSVAWTRDPVTGKPWLCIAGQNPKHIIILDIESGQPARTLAGHGRSVNDLAVSPLSTSLLLSAAEDKTIRLWNLEPSHAEQPCIALLSGEGHKDPVLAIHFHPNGRWLLSGGIDNAVCLWAIPSLDELSRPLDAEGIAEVGEPRIIYYPHFYTQEVHSNYVDCLAFYGDLIISRASRDQSRDNIQNEILIWKIDGFDSDDSPPSHPPIPIPGERTRSSFPHQKGFRGFQRLLTLSMQRTDRFYHRFGLYHAPNARPILAMGDQRSTYHFWDLHALEDGIGSAQAEEKQGASKKGKSKATASNDHNRLGDRRLAEDTTGPLAVAPIGPRENPLSDRFVPIESHHRKKVDSKWVKTDFGTSQIAWSPDGTWMVGVGDFGMMCLFHRNQSAVYAGAAS